MNTTVIISALATVIFLCGLAFAFARHEDKKMENIHRRLKELEGKKKEG